MPPQVTSISSLMGMSPQRMMTPSVNANGISQAKANVNSDEKSNPSKKETVSSNRGSVVASNGIKPSGPMVIDGEVREASKAVKEASINLKTDTKGSGKSSSFEKIMVKLNTQFPKHSRFVEKNYSFLIWEYQENRQSVCVNIS